MKRSIGVGVGRSEPLGGPEPASACAGTPLRPYPCYTDTTPSPAEMRQAAYLGAVPAVLDIYSYPDGSRSGTAWLARGQRSPDGSPDPSWYAVLTAEERDQENNRRSARRSVVDFQRKVRSADLTRLLTFTNGHTGEGWTSRADCLRDVYAWVSSAEGRRLLLGSAVAVIAERGAVAGRWHAHAAVRRNGRLDYRGIIRSWSAHLESLGYHSATGTHRFHAGDDSGKHSDGFASSRVCARYLTKYLTKSLGSERGPKAAKSYRCLDLAAPTPTRHILASLDDAGAVVADSFGSLPVYFQDADGFTIGFWFDSLPDGGG